MRKILLAAVFLFVAGFGSNGTSQVTTATFSGDVYDYDFGPSEPMIGVGVVAMNERTGKLYASITGPDGHFTISGLAVGEYWVSFSYVGYETVVLTGMPAVLGQTTRFHVGMVSEAMVIN